MGTLPYCLNAVVVRAYPSKILFPLALTQVAAAVSVAVTRHQAARNATHQAPHEERTHCSFDVHLAHARLTALRDEED